MYKRQVVNVSCTKADIAAVLRGDKSVDEFVSEADVTGDHAIIKTIFLSLDSFSGIFGIVEP